MCKEYFRLRPGSDPKLLVFLDTCFLRSPIRHLDKPCRGLDGGVGVGVRGVEGRLGGRGGCPGGGGHERVVFAGGKAGMQTGIHLPLQLARSLGDASSPLWCCIEAGSTRAASHGVVWLALQSGSKLWSWMPCWF